MQHLNTIKFKLFPNNTYDASRSRVDFLDGQNDEAVQDFGLEVDVETQEDIDD